MPPYAHHPGTLQVRFEHLLEPELVPVDLLITMAQTKPAPPSASAAPAPRSPSPAGRGRKRTRKSQQGADADAEQGSAATWEVALEVDGPMHYMLNDQEHMDGRTVYRDRLLARRLGAANVLVLRTRDWIELQGPEQKRLAVWRLLQRATPPPPPAVAGATGTEAQPEARAAAEAAAASGDEAQEPGRKRRASAALGGKRNLASPGQAAA